MQLIDSNGSIFMRNTMIGHTVKRLRIAGASFLGTAINAKGFAYSNGDQQFPQSFYVGQIGEPAILGANAKTFERAQRHVLFVAAAAGFGFDDRTG